MQFEKPEFFYLLIALIIPVLVHLFQLRRFKVQEFTNVAALQKIIIENRHSRVIKKWLVLILRVLAITSIILAFTKPFTNKYDSKVDSAEIVIYIDNSFSMEARGDSGPLLKQAVQNILTSSIPIEKISVFTNTKTYRNRRLKELKQELLDIKYSSNQLSVKNALIKGNNLFDKSKKNKRYLIYISDFQRHKDDLKITKDSSYELILLPKRPVKNLNNYIEKIQVKNNQNNYELEVFAKKSSNNIDPLSISLYNKSKLIGKTLVENSKDYKTTFTIDNSKSFLGKFVLDDNGLIYDNDFYFNITKTNKIDVLGLGDSEPNYLSKIFTDDKFLYEFSKLKNLDYSKIQQKDLVIISEPKNLSKTLINNLKSFLNSGGTVIFIPSVDGKINNYNEFLEHEKISFKKLIKNEKKITGIEFDHPIFKKAFKRNVSNFNYPKVKTYYEVSTSAKSLLSFEGDKPFLIQKRRLFFFTAAIELKNSDFTNSPLIVTALYAIGKSSFKNSNLYYDLGTKNELDFKHKLKNNSVVKLISDGEIFVPNQMYKNSKLKITFEDLPTHPGHYALCENNDTLQLISFNHNRNESLLHYHNLEYSKSYKIVNSIENSMESIKSEVLIDGLWKWFVIFAILFLVLELLILKIFE